MELAPDQVHVWQARFDAIPAAAAPAPDRSILAPEEIARAERMSVPRARAAFLASRTLLRRVLAKYAGRGAAQLQIHVEDSGKPRLEAPAWLHFNLAHTPTRWVCAVARDRDVGIDVEDLDRQVDVDAVARRLFHADELAALMPLDVAARRRAFFRVWAQREAVVKAGGEGMLEHGREFAVEGDPARAVGVRGRQLGLAEVDVSSECICVTALESRRRPFEVVSQGW